MDNEKQRYYNPDTLNKVFTFSSIFLLISLVAMFFHDYSREWRQHQARFRDLDVRIAGGELNIEQERLAKEKEYGKLKSDLNAARDRQSKNGSDLNHLAGELSNLTKKRDMVREDMNFQKAERDAVKYEFEQAREEKSSRAGQLEKALLSNESLLTQKKLDVERLETKMAEKQAAIKEKTAGVAAAEKELSKLTYRKDLLVRKLDILDQSRMSLLNKLGDKVRDLPGLDMANPRYNVRDQQIIVEGITEDLIFTRVPRVDRCKACHLGVLSENFKDQKNPYKSHPNLDLFLTQSSAHPIKEFGCTSCHRGRGRGTSFTTSSHMPNSKEQHQKWEEEHDWEKLHHWDAPMYPSRYTQAGCYKCHANEPELKGAHRLNLGLAIVRKAGCNGCHSIDRFNGEPKAGPSLRGVKSKLSTDWAFQWVKDPKSFRKHTWMPSFFKQSNNSDMEDRTDVELHSMIHYLFSNSEEVSPRYSMTDITRGNVENGKRLTRARGCQACHMLKEDKFEETLSVDGMRRQQGPRLVGMAAKTTPPWLYNWLKDPASLDPATRMPNMRLSDDDARDIAAYLLSVKTDEEVNVPVTKLDTKILDELTVELMAKVMTYEAAVEKLRAMNTEGKLEYTGKVMVRQYGCFGCHDIPGFENEQPIGTDLSEEGSKPIAQLDFGLRHDLEHVNYAWFEQKLRDPRIFDHGLEKKPGERLRMPFFGFDEKSIEAVVTCLLAFSKPDSELKKATPRTLRNILVEEGEKLITQLNCRGCHLINGSGGAVRDSVVEWATAYPPDQKTKHESEPDEEDDGWGEEKDDVVDPKVLALSYMPPALTGEGAKVQPEWLFHFLGVPTKVRTWLEITMPTYSLSEEEKNTILRYFSYLDNQKFPFERSVIVDKGGEDFQVAQTMFSPTIMNCQSCHVVAGKTPVGKTAAEWAPDLGMAKKRLKPEWVLNWLTDPQALIPGTKMPQYWPKDEPSPLSQLNGDSLRQRKAMRDYLMTFE